MTAPRFKPFQNSYLSQAEQMYCARLSHRVQILSASSAIEAAVHVRSEYYRGTHRNTDTLLQQQGANKHASASISALIDNNGEPDPTVALSGCMTCVIYPLLRKGSDWRLASILGAINRCAAICIRTGAHCAPLRRRPRASRTRTTQRSHRHSNARHDCAPHGHDSMALKTARRVGGSHIWCSVCGLVGRARCLETAIANAPTTRYRRRRRGRVGQRAPHTTERSRV